MISSAVKQHNPNGNLMRYTIPCVLLALTTCLYADEPKSKAIRKYENEVEVLRKQGQAAIKRLEGVFEKEVEKLREKTLTALQEELDAALEVKDLDKAVALREAIKAFEDGDESGLSAKSDAEGKAAPASKEKFKKRIPKEAVSFGGHKYYLVTTQATWDEGAISSSRVGGHLVRIDSIAEHDFLIRYLKSVGFAASVWVDGTRRLDGKTWLFGNGQNVDFGRMRVEPLENKNPEPYLHMVNVYQWRVHDSYLGKHAYIIEWDN